MKKLAGLLSCFFIAGLSGLYAQDAKALQETARNFSKEGDFSNAILVLNKAHDQDANNMSISKDLALAYFQKLQTYSPDFDIIGLSYYPWWHGMDMNVLKQTMDQLNSTFHKPLLIAETAYPFTLQWNDWTNNLVGLSSQLMPGYDATQSGQSKFLSDLKTVVRSSSSLDHTGVCYWAGDYVAFRGTTATDGSPWENLALFDFQYKALPALDSLGK